MFRTVPRLQAAPPRVGHSLAGAQTLAERDVGEVWSQITEAEMQVWGFCVLSFAFCFKPQDSHRFGRHLKQAMADIIALFSLKVNSKK